MSINLIHYECGSYPEFQRQGNAAQFCIPFAKHVCEGVGVDIGPGKLEWAFPGAIPIDPALGEYHATNYPYMDLDYVFSSHCLEHIPNWIDAIHYWHQSLKKGGVLFLYLPDYSQTYWRPWNNRKHLHIFNSDIIHDVMRKIGFHKIFYSDVDLNNSFTVMGEKF